MSWISASRSIRKWKPIGRIRRKAQPDGLGSRLRAELSKRNQRLPLLGDDATTADRNYIKEFGMARSRELGKQYGVEYAEAFHYIAPGASGADRDPKVDAYVKEHAVPSK